MNQSGDGNSCFGTTASQFELHGEDSANCGVIMIVEDEDVVLNVATRILNNAGFHVVSATDGHKAIELFRQMSSQIRLIVMDALMPGLDGRETYDSISKIRENVPVLFCSGYSKDVLQAEYLVSIPGDLLQKPYRAADLLGKIKKLLAASQATLM